MDWLMYIIMIILFAAVLVLLWKNYRIKKEAKLFAEKVEDALDTIVTGKEWNMEEELEDSLWGRTGTQLAKAGNVFRKKEEDGFREKERVKGLLRRGRQRSLQDFTVSRRFMINQELESDYILREQSWSFRRDI